MQNSEIVRLVNEKLYDRDRYRQDNSIEDQDIVDLREAIKLYNLNHY